MDSNISSFTFSTPLNVNIVEIKGVEHTFVEGDISTNDIDFVDDIMSKKCQESMQKQILERNMKLDLEHEAFKGDTHEEKEINKTKIPAGKLIDATVKHLGKNRYSTRVKGEINRHNTNYKNTKGNLLDGYLDAFSVAFLPKEIKYEEKEGRSIRVLDDVTLLNVALTGNPCNTKAQLVNVFTKSMDALEEYKKRKEIDPSVEKTLIVKSKSNSTGIPGHNKLNFNKNSKMTDEDTKPTPDKDPDPKPDDGNESTEAEQKAMFKSMSEEMKTLTAKYDEVAKENVGIKEDLKEISKNLLKITEALSQPIHKSKGAQDTDVKKAKAEAEGKSVDPLSLF